jgi:hypothetical protein
MTDWKAGTGQKINRMYLWVCEEPDGGEGVLGGMFKGSWVMLAGADRARIESFRPHAEAIARKTGYPVRLKMFGSGVVIDEIKV